MAFCIIEKSHYCDYVLPTINKLKLKYFNRTDIILHERDIRKQSGIFSCLCDKNIQDFFMKDLTQIIINTQFTVISCVIDKANFKAKYSHPEHPYHLATSMCLERLCHFLKENKEDKHINITFEARGAKEDKELQQNFDKFCTNANAKITIIPKINNCVGLQFADLIARPIGRHILNPNQPNRSFDIIKYKLRSDNNGNYIGRGLKIFP